MHGNLKDLSSLPIIENDIQMSTEKRQNISTLYSSKTFRLMTIFRRISEEEFQDIMKIKDTDNDGSISIKEFLNKGPTMHKSDLAFQLLDK